MSDELKWFWLSFCDPEKPTGTHFLGACFVRGTSIKDAIQTSHRLRINPGGEVRFTQIDDPTFTPSAAKTYRLMDRKEAEAYLQDIA